MSDLLPNTSTTKPAPIPTAVDQTISTGDVATRRTSHEQPHSCLIEEDKLATSLVSTRAELRPLDTRLRRMADRMTALANESEARLAEHCAKNEGVGLKIKISMPVDSLAKAANLSKNLALVRSTRQRDFTGTQLDWLNQLARRKD